MNTYLNKCIKNRLGPWTILFLLFFLISTRGFPHFDGGEYFVWPMYVCSVLSIGKEGLSEFI